MNDELRVHFKLIVDVNYWIGSYEVQVLIMDTKLPMKAIMDLDLC